MRIALIADVHSNIVALESVMKAIRLHRPDRIISLGDQVNLGPCPRETLALLKAENVTCLQGNHERYVLGAMANEPAYQGANFAAPRFTASLLTPEEITFPKTMELEGITFCHALPDDDRFPVYESSLILPKLKEMNFERPTHIICGHGHNPTHVRSGHVTLDSIGAVGCMDKGVPGTAPFVILTLEDGQAMLRPHYVSYETRHMKSIFKRSGMVDACPIMARIICLQMMHNQDYLVHFVRQAQEISRGRGETMISQESWRLTDKRFIWPINMSTQEFWK